MKKQILLLGVLLSLNGLTMAKNNDINQEPLAQNNNPLYYKIDIVDSGKLKDSLKGSFIGSTNIESLKQVSYLKEISTTTSNNVTSNSPDQSPLNNNLVLTKGIIDDGINVSITPNNIQFSYTELTDLSNALTNHNAESIQIPTTRKISYQMDKLNLSELKGCLVNNLKKESQTKLASYKNNPDSYISFQLCDSEKGLN